MMNWLLKAMADEKKYYRIFLATLSLYALICTIIFGVCINYAPGAAKYIALATIFGSALVGVAGRVTHTLCYAKVHEDDYKDSV